MTQTYRAYEVQNGKPVRVLRQGSYEALRAWADERERRGLRQTGVFSPVWVDSIIYPVGA